MKAEKRELILRAALELFAEQGFRGTSTAQIAKQAGVATGTLFHHFASKEELINTLYRDIKTDMAERLLHSIEGDDPPREKMRLVWFEVIAWALENRAEYQFKKHCEASPDISEQLRQECEAKFVAIFTLFTQAAENGLLKDLPIDLLMNLMAGTMDGFINYLEKHPEDIANKQLWEQAYSATWDAIR